jgi:hypothetical protein
MRSDTRFNMRSSLLAIVLILDTTSLAQNPNTFWNDYPACEEQCHISVWNSRACSLQNSCSGCSGCLCLSDNCLCTTNSWFTAVAQCITKQCGASAAVDAANTAASGCAGRRQGQAIPQAQLASIGEAAASTQGKESCSVSK